jgi:hypothetical protein
LPQAERKKAEWNEGYGIDGGVLKRARILEVVDRFGMGGVYAGVSIDNEIALRARRR